MTSKAGKNSSRVSRNWNAPELHPLAVTGTLVALGLIGVSAALNFRFAYRMADTQVDAWLYGAGVALGDVIKAMAPFTMAWGWRYRRPAVVIAAGVFFAVASAYSLASATGYAAQHRLTKHAAAEDVADRRRRTRRDYERIQARLERLGTQRSTDEIDKAVDTLMKRPLTGGTVGTISGNCTLNRAATREPCEEHARLLEERERAREVVRLEGEAAKLAADLARQRVDPSPADAQVDAFTTLTEAIGRPTSRQTVESVLVLGFAVLIELGSGLGLFLVSTPWRPPHLSSNPSTEILGVMESNLGYVDVFLSAKLIDKEGGELTLGQLFLAYVSWCRGRSEVPLSKAEFSKQMAIIAEAVHIPSKGDGAHRVYRDVALDHGTGLLRAGMKGTLWKP